MVRVSLDDYVWKTVEEISTPRPGPHDIALDWWWPVDAEGRVAFYNPLNRHTGQRQRTYGSPQGNKDEKVSRLLSRHDPWAVDVIQIPIAYIPIDTREF